MGVVFDIDREDVMAKANTRNLGRTLTDNETYGAGFMERMSFWKNRVIPVGGGRITRAESATGGNGHKTHEKTRKQGRV